MIWIDTIIQGILLGGLYALFAAGLSLVFGIMRLVNLAHGDLIVLGAYLILVFVTLSGMNPFLAALLAAPCMFVLGWLLRSPRRPTFPSDEGIVEFSAGHRSHPHKVSGYPSRSDRRGAGYQHIRPLRIQRFSIHSGSPYTRGCGP